jgi:hypothetical protein
VNLTVSGRSSCAVSRVIADMTSAVRLSLLSLLSLLSSKSMKRSKSPPDPAPTKLRTACASRPSCMSVAAISMPSPSMSDSASNMAWDASLARSCAAWISAAACLAASLPWCAITDEGTRASAEIATAMTVLRWRTRVSGADRRRKEKCDTMQENSCCPATCGSGHGESDSSLRVLVSATLPWGSRCCWNLVGGSRPAGKCGGGKRCADGYGRDQANRAHQSPHDLDRNDFSSCD